MVGAFQVAIFGKATDGDVQRASAAGQGRDRRGRRDARARAPRRGSPGTGRRARARASGTRATSPERCTFLAGTSSRGSRTRRRTSRARSSSTARPGTALPSPPRRSRSSATSTSSPSRAASRTGSGTAIRSRSRSRSTKPKRRRYSRHLLIPEVGEEGQLRLSQSRVLLIGAGGLGSPASLYLAAAGVGTLGIVDDDVVDETNLQRQIVHSTERLGESKAESAKRTIEALNPGRHRQGLQGAPDVRERRSHPRRRLGRDRRRRRQLPDALPPERRVGLAQDSGRPRLDLPLRGPGHGLQAARGPLLPLPVPAAAAARAGAELRRGRRAGRASRASSARCRRTRRSSSCSASASRSSAAC